MSMQIDEQQIRALIPRNEDDGHWRIWRDANMLAPA